MENHLRKNNGLVRHHRVIGGGMAYFYRLILFVFGFFLFSVNGTAFASFPASQNTSPDSCTVAPCYSWKNPYSSTLFNTAVAACTDNAAIKPPNPAGSTYSFSSVSSTTCRMNWTYPTGSCQDCATDTMSTILRDPDSAYSCPVNSTLSGSSCTCNSGFSESNGTCKSTAVLDKESCDSLASGLNLVGAPLVHYGSAGLTACFGGFVVSGSGSASGGGQTELYGPFACSGTSASSCAVATKPTDITATCAAGSYPGTVNGVQVCVPPSSTTTAPEKTAVTPPAPGASAPVIPDAPVGTESTEKSTTCTGTTCTTTTTYRDGAGTSLGEKKEDKPITSFCQENPKAPGCKELVEGTFSGSCGAVPACTGDAIQCAAAKAAFASACVLDMKANAESALYDAAKTVDQSKSVLTESQVSITSSMFNSSNILGAGSGCIADKNVTISGHSMTLPFSSICQYLEYIGFLNLAIAFVLAGRIVARG
jgi:hypothetical protein